MAIRHEHLDEEQLARQHRLDRSWKVAQESLGDPVFLEYVESAIERVNQSKAEHVTAEEFLAQTEPPKE
jgi:hypothetical protein